MGHMPMTREDVALAKSAPHVWSRALNHGTVMGLEQIAKDLESGSYPSVAALTEEQRDAVVVFLREQARLFAEASK